MPEWVKRFGDGRIRLMYSACENDMNFREKENGLLGVKLYPPLL